MLYYCDKCGNLGDEFDTSCFCCGNSPLKPIPREYVDNFRWRDGDGKEAFMEEVVKKSPNLDPYLFEHRDKIIDQKNDEMKASIAIGKAILEEKSKVPKCPTCGSTNIRKMGGVERGASIWAFGIFSKKINKTFKCGNCGYTW